LASLAVDEIAFAADAVPSSLAGESLKGTVLFLLIFDVKSAKQVPFTIQQSDLNIEKRVSKQTGVKTSVRSRVC
jgi:hypothetical protein